MKILGARYLVSKVEKPQTAEGEFKTVEVQDDFLYKAKVEQVGDGVGVEALIRTPIAVGDVILFARNSPDTQDVEHEGRKLKIVRYEDIIAIL